MMRRSGKRRAGFTLIEMLVVITIIIVLIGLLVPAVVKVQDAGNRAENRARLLAINTAMNTVKGNSAFGNPKYIPAGRPTFDANGRVNGAAAFRLRNKYPATGSPNVNDFEAQYLIATFNIPIDDGGGIGGLYGGQDFGGLSGNDYPTLSADLDANQTLMFFLGGIPEPDANGTAANFPGFHPNPRTPLKKRTTASDPRKNTGMDFGTGKDKPKYVLSKVGGVDFARLVDPYGRPYAYFVAYNGLPNQYFGHNADAALFQGVQAYKSNPTLNAYENASGYQLISSGKDKKFGLTGNLKDIRTEGRDDYTNIIEMQLGSQ